MHVHLRYRSRCSNLEMDDIYNNLSERIDGVCITDHWRLKPLMYNPFEDNKVFIGTEISCVYGDILAYGVKSIPLRNRHLRAEDALELIHNQGGIAVCAHPFSNRHDSFGKFVYDYEFDALEINGGLDKKFRKMAEDTANEMDIPLVGGSDAHAISQLNTIATKFTIPINTIEDIVKAVKNRECKPTRIF